MFKSTAFKLTMWYVALLVLINVILAAIYFQISIDNTRQRIDSFYALVVESVEENGTEALSETTYAKMQSDYIDIAANSLMVRLSLYIFAILLLSGIISYILSFFTLKPVNATHEAQKQFASDVSHELSTPLAAMKSEIEVTLRDPSVTKAQLEKTLRSTLEEIETLSSVTESMLMMSRLENAKALEKQQLDLKLAAMEAMYRFKDGAERIKLTGKTGLIITANEQLVIEQFSILIDNALKYSPKDSVVKVRVYHKGTNHYFEVSNSGEGISAEDQKRIFDRFYRADNSRSHSVKTSGFGLGLSIAAQIAKLHKARINVESRANKRTTFTVIF